MNEVQGSWNGECRTFGCTGKAMFIPVAHATLDDWYHQYRCEECIALLDVAYPKRSEGDPDRGVVLDVEAFRAYAAVARFLGTLNKSTLAAVAAERMGE